MARPYLRSRRVIVYRERDISPDSYETVCLEIECSVGPVSHDPHEYGQREIEIIEVRDQYGTRPDILDALSEAEIDSIYCEAADEVDDRWRAQRDAEADLRIDEDRDRRRGLLD